MWNLQLKYYIGMNYVHIHYVSQMLLGPANVFRVVYVHLSNSLLSHHRFRQTGDPTAIPLPPSPNQASKPRHVRHGASHDCRDIGLLYHKHMHHHFRLQPSGENLEPANHRVPMFGQYHRNPLYLFVQHRVRSHHSGSAVKGCLEAKDSAQEKNQYYITLRYRALVRPLSLSHTHMNQRYIAYVCIQADRDDDDKALALPTQS